MTHGAVRLLDRKLITLANTAASRTVEWNAVTFMGDELNLLGGAWIILCVCVAITTDILRKTLQSSQHG